MKILIYCGLAIYFAFYLFEGPIRYGFNIIGADYLIFIRDLVLVSLIILLILIKQSDYKISYKPFLIFAIIIFVHGFVSFVNLRNSFIIFYCIKLFFSGLAGAVLSPYIINPPHKVVKAVFILWIITIAGVFLDKYFIEYPWTGLATTIGDVQVDISHNWEISGADKRAAGFMRSSINVAIIVPMLAFMLMLNASSFAARMGIMVMTMLTVYWSTQKASIIAFALVGLLLIAAYRHKAAALKIGISFGLILAVTLPIILPHFIMPSTEGMFSLNTFYMRVEEMWPKAWKLIESRELFPFGIGLGGISGAQRFYDQYEANAADNMFVFMYAFFGVLSFIYIGWLWWVSMRVSNKGAPATIYALSIVMFISFYGVALSMLEDQMVTLFLGAAAVWIAKNKSSAAALSDAR